MLAAFKVVAININHPSVSFSSEHVERTLKGLSSQPCADRWLTPANPRQRPQTEAKPQSLSGQLHTKPCPATAPGRELLCCISPVNVSLGTAEHGKRLLCITMKNNRPSHNF